MRLTERFTRVNAEAIDYQFTMDDPAMFTRPWTAAFPLTTNQASRGVTVGQLLRNTPATRGITLFRNVLAGARAKDGAAEKGAQKGSK